MPFIENIVDYINATLKAGSLKDKRFQTGKFLGLTTIVAKRKADKSLAIYPGIVNTQGEFTTVEPNDKFPIVVYHKVLSSGYGYEKDNSYGNTSLIKSQTEMSMIVWGDSNKLKLSASRLEAVFLTGFPQRLSEQARKDLGLRMCLFTPLSSDMDQLRVFRGEYQNVDYFLKPQHSFFQIRYRVDMSFDQGCLDACGCN
jgi:hypothetical protein